MEDLSCSERGSPPRDAANYAFNERRLLAKIDLRILPTLSVLFLLAFIDRVNIGNAILFSLEEDLGLTSYEYNTALCVFFVSYVIFEIPGNVLMKRIKPHIFLSVCMFTFGLLVVIQGFCRDFGGLVTIRFLLGVVEAGVVPGCFYIISMWYQRSESQKRFSFFYNAATLAGAFGGLIASGIGKLDGARGYHGWKWIFWIEGACTCALSAAAFFLLPDFPEDATWLTGEERAYVLARLAKDQGGDNGFVENISVVSALRTFREWKMVPIAIAHFGLSVSAYGLAYFVPTIVESYGYSPITSQLLSVPPWASAFVYAMIIAYISDRLSRRFPFVVFGIVLALAGCTTLFAVSQQRDAQYAALCLYLMGVWGTLPVLLCWNVMNLQGHRQRIVGTGLQIGCGNVAAIVATWSFPESDSPEYRLGYSLGIGCLVVGLALSVLYWAACVVENKRRRSKGEIELFL